MCDHNDQPVQLWSHRRIIRYHAGRCKWCSGFILVTISQVNNLYTYDSHGVTQVAVNGLLDSRGTITQQNVGTVESNTIDSVQVLANIGVDESGTTTQGNSGIVYNTVGSTQVLGNIDDPTLHYDLNGLILNYI